MSKRYSLEDMDKLLMQAAKETALRLYQRACSDNLTDEQTLSIMASVRACEDVTNNIYSLLTEEYQKQEEGGND